MKATGRGKQLMTEINMVPFIDIVLVLLIIFMVMSPFLAQSQIAVNLPQAVSAQPVADDTPIKVQITRGGDLYVRGQPVSKDDLSQRLRTALMMTSNKAILIEADKGVPFEEVVRVLDIAEQINAAK